MRINVADAVTLSRVVLSPLLLFVDPYSWTFLALFLVCGATDVLDGWLARRLKIESEFGGKLDSFADLVMFLVLFYVVISNVDIPMIVWVMVAAIVVIKVASFVIGRENGFFGFRHSPMNRATGVVVFLSIPLFLHLEPLVVGTIVCCFALVAALDELASDVRDAGYIKDRCAR